MSRMRNRNLNSVMMAEQNCAYLPWKQIPERKRTRYLALVKTLLDCAIIAHRVIRSLKVELQNFRARKGVR